MGILLSRFRKKKTTIEILDSLETKIKAIEQYGTTTEQRHKKIVGTLIIYSVILYIVTAVLFYFYFFPASLYDQLFYIIPLLIFPLLIVFTKKMVTWYYKRKISRNQEKLVEMQKEKKKILDEVTETETYKKAKEILLKFAPDQLRMSPLTPQPVSKISMSTATNPRAPSTPQTAIQSTPNNNELRKRTLTNVNPVLNASIGRPVNSGRVPLGFASPANTPQQIPYYQPTDRLQNASLMHPRSPLPRPILPQQRSYLDRLVEYLVGDGPSNRYALICHQCDSHNGMALKEEFEYFGFRCCYCNYWNPARKQKPSAPKLEMDLTSSHSSENQSKSTDDILTSSETDSDIEVVEKPETPENEMKQSEKIDNKIEVDSNEKEEDNLVEKKNTEDTTKLDDNQLEKMEIDESPR
ncbi:endoplasmic reticulum junction formation protein lunapark-A isoform X1 [Chelonus insularis]|uniref:endoplasmic reticulum junction formation protein lunapark-A isoform X1 n=1 Tax=Chelonus insularis TaxID=460826 RepID=UPI00158F67D4|nr:endoplasmic reticulum junction formation protein lunapark-A isoform X1 [Chelonus insularis]